jgi:flavin-dependent dehydrogenase
LPTQPKRRRAAAGDLFGFKAHFRNTTLAADLMPLLSFPGGYGGMVHVGGDSVSLSCCIRRDALARWRSGSPADAGEIVESHIRSTCVGVRRSLDGAERIGGWLAAGPIRPGMRLTWPTGVFAVGNAAGEAHPVVAEGISMAMQSAWLLARELETWRRHGLRQSELPCVADRYARRWRCAFRPRLIAAAAVARWAMSPRLMASSLPIFRKFPALLTWGAAVTGKSTRVVRSSLPSLTTASVP